MNPDYSNLATKVNWIREIRLEDTVVPMNVFYNVSLITGRATVIPVWKNPNSSIEVFSSLPTPTRTDRAISYDLKETVKTQISKINEIRTEPTTALDYIYPVEVSADTANVLPLQAVISSYIHVAYALPLGSGLGRSISFDLSTYAKTKIESIRELRLEETNAPLSVVYPVVLSTAGQATFLPFWNNPNSSIEMFSELPSSARTGRAISYDIKQSVKTILNNVSPTQFFGYPNYAGDARFYKIGRLYLPIGGHQAVIAINLCYGFNVNNTGLNYAGYIIQNYEMKIYLYSSTPGASRACFPDSFGPNIALRSDNNYSLFHNGYVVVSSPFVSALGIYLSPVPSDNRNQVDIWVHSYMYHGYPLIQVSQAVGSFTKDTTTVLTELPLLGYVKLDMFSNTLTQIYRNPYNV